MSFDHQNYVPVLKVKRGEKAALGLISEKLKKRIIPLLEIVERNKSHAPQRSVDQHIETSFDKLAENLVGYSRCFIDCKAIAPDGPMAVHQIFKKATDGSIVFTPVTGLSRTADVYEAMNFKSNGIAIRVTADEIIDGKLGKKLAKFLEKFGLNHSEVDLIIDFGAIEDLILDGVESSFSEALDEIPHIKKWRTLTFSSCAFPASMAGVERHSHEFIERTEWLAWRNVLLENAESIERLPTFSDCAIQHPRGVEGFNPLIMSPSACVRYTLRDQWLLIKGESTARSSPTNQFPILAKKLAYEDLSEYFFGANHCKGCESMERSAKGTPKLGSAEVWRKLGTIHHITMVAADLEALFAP